MDMSFEPEPGISINLGAENIEFIPLEPSGPASVFVYAESGREGIVYKVLKNRKFYALKVFYPQYRDKRLLETTEKLSRFKDLEGFGVAERIVINHEAFPKAVNRYPDLNYAMLMPWIEGTVWGNLMLEVDHPLQRESYFQIIQTLTRVVGNLEAKGWAHCDLSNNNFIIAQDFASIQLIDIENIYAPDMPRPIPDISYGTIGYRTRWIAENGLWGPESDRFAFAILCSEIFTWHNKEIRESKAENTSFFAEEEIGEVSDRYQLMTKHLRDWNKDLARLFEMAWFAKNSNQCPPISEWIDVIGKLEVQPGTKEETAGIDINELQVKTLVMKKISETVSSGVPPKMEISHEIIDFGVLHQPNISSEFHISNTGGSTLIGDIKTESWMEISPNQFSIQPDQSQTFKVTLNTTFPRPKTGLEYRTASALAVESNIGGEIIGASFRLAPPPFYKSLSVRAVVRETMGFMVIISFLCLIAAVLYFSR
jgi:tRNA A-37 threonylcarbamoyl transferase component Bud32